MIFVNTDFNYTLASQKLLSTYVTHRQSSTLKVVQSNSKGNGSIFAFGGILDNRKTQNQRALAFGRTASAVFRMVMLQAVQINERHWPNLGKRTMRRNKPAIRFEITQSPDRENSEFKLLRNVNNTRLTRKIAHEYWSRYDKMFPHFFIQNEVLKNIGREVVFKNTMLILRNSEEVKQVIEITTEACATMYPTAPGWKTGEFDSHVKVSCTCKAIVDNHNNRQILNRFRALRNVPSYRPHTRSRHVALNLLTNNQ